jgi:HPt (histidine-containing phosphotransfer) domain-containing protein
MSDETSTQDGRSGDPEALRRLHRFGGRALVDQMVALFAEQAPLRIGTARDALSSGDIATVQRMAHMMKSSSAQLGAERLHLLSVEAERQAETGEMATIPPLLNAMDTEFEQWKTWVDSLDLGAKNG